MAGAFNCPWFRTRLDTPCSPALPVIICSHRPDSHPSNLEGGLDSPPGLTLCFKKAWAKCLRLAGISDFRFHDTRHISATNLVDNGTPERVVMAVAGWRTNMLSTYYHRAGKNSRALVTFAPHADFRWSATLAQLVEQRFRKAWVLGSIPGSGSISPQAAFPA